MPERGLDSKDNYSRSELMEFASLLESFFEKVEAKKTLLQAFHSAVESIPNYKMLLKRRKLDPASVKTILDFRKRVPILSKKSVFYSGKLEGWLSATVSDSSNIMVSSGFSGKPSFGFISPREEDKDATAIKAAIKKEVGLSYNAMLINCLSMGVTVRTGIPTAGVGTRTDLAAAIVERMYNSVKQFIVLADPLVAKMFAEELRMRDIPLKKLKIHIFSGGDSFSNSFRLYVHKLLQTNFNGMNKRALVGTMGLTELGLNLFFDSRESAELRDKMQKDSSTMEKVLGLKLPFAPPMMHYDPSRIFLEFHNSVKGDQLSGFGDMVISHLETELLKPLIRYNTGDLGKEVLKNSEIPIISILGRKKLVLPVAGNLSVQAVKEALYRKEGVARAITGFFQVGRGKKPVVTVQLKRETKGGKEVEKAISQELSALLGSKQFEIRVVPFYSFPAFLQSNFDNKVQYLERR